MFWEHFQPYCHTLNPFGHRNMYTIHMPTTSVILLWDTKGAHEETVLTPHTDLFQCHVHFI